MSVDTVSLPTRSPVVPRDLAVAGVVFAWVPLVLLADASGVSLAQQRALGAATWLLLAALLRGETLLTRFQVAVVVVFATAVEYTCSPLLEVYVYRLHNVPAYVPPGHGMVYLCALALGRSAFVAARRHALVTATVAAGGGYAVWGLVGGHRLDVLGALWFGCLLLFLRFGRNGGVYVGAFAIVTYLELIGTAAGTWTWSLHDPTGLIGIGNPPSGAAGGYGFFDAAALAAAPALTRWWAGR